MSTNPITTDNKLLTRVVDIAKTTGASLLEVFSPGARPASRGDMFTVGQRNEELALSGLRDALAELRPGARWAGDEQESAELPEGEWWVVDPVEGGVNLVHGLPEWCVSVTLVRDGVPVLTAVHQPVGDLTYTAVRGEGAWLNGTPLKTSAKTSLDAAIVATSQTGSGDVVRRRLGDSVTTMLGRALFVRTSVPSTFPLLLIATGQHDVFWQYEPYLTSVAAGVLLVTEAGGVATDLGGKPWRPGSPDLVISAPGVHTAAVEALSTVA